MYFGSVRFFKHLIIAAVALLILIPTAFAVFFGVKSGYAEDENQRMTAAQEEIQDRLNETENELAAVQSELEAQPTLSEIEHYTKDGTDVRHEDVSLIAYQQMYPDMYVSNPQKRENSKEKTVYLTFDDGPSANTPAVLDILDKYGIKATFFVVYKNDDFSNSMYKAIADRGHTIAIHSASHDYKKIYSSVAAFLDDFDIIYNHIYDVTGVEPKLFRFPGGSVNGYNSGIYMELIAEMTRRGFVYHDWNVSAQDASAKATAETIYQNVAPEVEKRDKSIVLMHDSSTRKQTISALPKIIEELQKAGYGFDKLDGSVDPFIFSYKAE